MQAKSSTQTAVSVWSSHPLVAQFLTSVVAVTVTQDSGTRVPNSFAELRPIEDGELLVLDGCCDDDWPKVALQWQKMGGRVVVLLSAAAGSPGAQLRALFLGVKGVVVISGRWREEIPPAVATVIEGGLWIRQDVMSQYIERLSSQRKNCPRGTDTHGQLTAREEQILSLLLRSYSNKEIANVLEIGERTAKYHVSNILQKCEVSNRRELLEIMIRAKRTKPSAA
jgi:two-component system, NarL family, nitrate/nitrite response regulator NarL